MRPNLILLALLSTALAHSHKSPTGRFRRTSFGKRRLSSEITRRATLFIPLDYTDGQISDGTAGSAQEEADAVCRAPFANVDLSTVSQEDLKNLATFRSAAESAETELFNPQIDAASGDAATALQNGKTKNKVLKLTCLIQVNLIKQAQGADQSAALTDGQKKLNANLANDAEASGQASTAAVA